MPARNIGYSHNAALRAWKPGKPPSAVKTKYRLAGDDFGATMEAAAASLIAPPTAPLKP
jgi:hypothetical protein